MHTELPRRYTYIYDKRGVEIHCLRDQTEPNVLQFLPHHFLLASVGKSGTLMRMCVCEFRSK
jgi:U3 small nucleolar RNA-associated protein 7